MKLIRNTNNNKLYIINDEKTLLETGRVGAEFVIYLYTKNKIIITKELDEYLYSNLSELLENKYIFANNNLSYQIDNKIVWFSDGYCSVEDKEETDKVSRLIIEKKDNEINISYSNPFYERYEIERDPVIAFSPAGNGFYSINIKTGLSFQDDIIIAFYKTYTKEKNKLKKKVKIK